MFVAHWNVIDQSESRIQQCCGIMYSNCCCSRCVFPLLFSTCGRLASPGSLWSSSDRACPSCLSPTGPPSPTCAPNTAPPSASSQSTESHSSTLTRPVSREREVDLHPPTVSVVWDFSYVSKKKSTLISVVWHVFHLFCRTVDQAGGTFDFCSKRSVVSVEPEPALAVFHHSLPPFHILFCFPCRL